MPKARLVAHVCKCCRREFPVPVVNMYLTWLAWWRVRWHRLWCRSGRYRWYP
jgi:hypothetical protein